MELFSAKVTDLKGVSAKAPPPIIVTLAGMLIVSSLDCLNAFSPMLAILLVPEKVTEVSPSAPKNA